VGRSAMAETEAGPPRPGDDAPPSDNDKPEEITTDAGEHQAAPAVPGQRIRVNGALGRGLRRGSPGPIRRVFGGA
jgi:hypothetical protein